MSFNPYKILGVKKKATSEQIRAAYIARAKVLHPDANGGEEEMKELNAAYDLLCDQEKRRRFDKSGFVDGDPEAEMKMAAHNNLCELFSQLLDKIPEHEITRVDVVAIMRDSSQVSLKNHEKQLYDLQRRKAKLERQMETMRKKLKRKKKGANIFLHVIEKKIEGVQLQIFPAENIIKVINMALKMLDAYEYEMDVESFQDFNIGFTNLIR